MCDKISKTTTENIMKTISLANRDSDYVDFEITGIKETVHQITYDIKANKWTGLTLRYNLFGGMDNARKIPNVTVNNVVEAWDLKDSV